MGAVFAAHAILGFCFIAAYISIAVAAVFDDDQGERESKRVSVSVYVRVCESVWSD